tara:strand:+ start:742 stop:1068 length:327 start_codon:yes stop_codon:yes gene_type:complete
MPTKKQKLAANETYFLQVISSLNEGGVWCWKDKQTTYKMKGGILFAQCEKGYKGLCEITSPQWSKKYVVNASRGMFSAELSATIVADPSLCFTPADYATVEKMMNALN